MNFGKIENWQEFPELKNLKDLSKPPQNIFYLGEWHPEIFENCVAVVGSRRITEYGRRVVEIIVPKLVFEKKTIVSGFMYGVDQYAHRVCLENGGRTIAVLGWGINYKLTGSDLKLAEKIIDNKGLLVSEWENQKPTLWTFPHRNRLVAALAREIIIIEAAEISGSLLTARIAKKLGRQVWAVPGPVTSKTSAGTNNLIASGQAKMWLNKNLLEKVAKPKNKEPLFDLLENEPATVDEIARKLNLPVAEIGARLSLLTLSGYLTEKGGKYYLNNAF